MRKLIVRVALPVVLLALAAPAFGGGLDRAGTSGAQELRIPVGAGSLGLGGSSVALGTGLGNIYWNPAALGGVDHPEAIVSYSTYLADAKVNYGAVSIRSGDAGAFAVALKVLNVGDITVTTEEAPEGTGEILSPNFSVLGLSYARRMTDRVLIGLTGNYINEKVAEVKATGFAFDLGVQYDTGWRGLRFGFAMKNVGPNMEFSGANLEERIILPGDDPTAQPHVVQLQSTEFELPSYLQFGLAYDLPVSAEQHVTLTGAFQSNNYTNDEFRVGGEYTLGEHVTLRGGYQNQIHLGGASQDNYLYGLSYGAGLHFRMGDTPLTLDWSGTTVGEFFDDNHQFTVNVAF